ncbi:MAG: nitroreductase family protein [Candidatus Pacebacteria bacterium]|jgi:nitroreductase|nr:nitroreductase family protein [Candidatus Paceibacterota bacterium]
MDIFKLIFSRRTIRRFLNKKIDRSYLEKMVQLGALAPSRVNMQPWEFIIIDDEKLKRKIFKSILWGSKNPTNKVFADPQYAPAAYIAILVNARIRGAGYEYEIGACAENIMLYAWSLGIGSVWLHALNRKKIISLLQIPTGKIFDSLIGLGYPAHTSKIAKFSNDNYFYNIDESLNLIVPKRDIRTLTYHNIYGYFK